MSFVVQPFEKSGFVALVANERATVEFIGANLRKFAQVTYLSGYVEYLGAQTAVVEHDYVDRDYLADYSSYYAACFEDFGSRCKRVHFFSTSFTEAELRRWIAHPTTAADAALQTGYLGFIVARPLPEAIIGRTVLKTYRSKSERQFATRPYEVSLFGLRLEVESLAYQQQDRVVAACATVALWTAFHKTSKLFEHPLLRPAEITSAANRVQGAGRAMPSPGLRAEQIFAAIRHAGLEPVAEIVNSQTLLMSLLKGYIDFGLPVILFGLLPQAHYAGHAVTVSGYSLGTAPPDFTETKSHGVDSVGRYIEKIYVHDDNIGPFARFFPVRHERYEDPLVHPSARAMSYGFEPRDPDNNPQSLFIPYMAVVPVYGKVRVTHSEAHGWFARTQAIIKQAGVPTDDLRWSIGLTTTQRYKTLLRERFADNPRCGSILFEGQPRFIWRGVAQRGDDLVVECLVDATGVSRSCPVFAWMWHDDAAREQYERGIVGIARSAIENTYSKTYADVVYPQGLTGAPEATLA